MAMEQKACLERLSHLDGTIQELLSNGSYYPWTALSQLEPPKAMSDIVESLLGAIYIDTAASMSACEAFLEHLGLMAYLRRVLTSDVALLHPKEELGHLADRDSVKYELGKEGEEGRQRLTCSVLIGGREVVSVGSGRSIMEVQTRAAEAACQSLKRHSISRLRTTADSSKEKVLFKEQVLKGCRLQGQPEMGLETTEESEEEREEDSKIAEIEQRGTDSDAYTTADDSW